MSSKDARPYWVDCVHGKHECFPYAEKATVKVVVNNREVEITVPDYLGDVKVFVTAENEGLLFCFGRTNEKFNNENCGLVMVAKRVAEDRYEVGVWHELYPWALKHFGYGHEV